MNLIFSRKLLYFQLVPSASSSMISPSFEILLNIQKSTLNMTISLLTVAEYDKVKKSETFHWFNFFDYFKLNGQENVRIKMQQENAQKNIKDI